MLGAFEAQIGSLRDRILFPLPSGAGVLSSLCSWRMEGRILGLLPWLVALMADRYVVCELLRNGVELLLEGCGAELKGRGLC